MKSLSLIALFLIAFLSPHYAAADNNDIVGTILEVEGTATITVPGNKPSSATITMGVHPGDLIETGPASRIYLQLIDNTELTLGENGRMVIDDYIYNPQNANDNKAAYSVMKGAFLYVSGLLAKRPDPQVTVNVPVGSIGIRGTKFWGGTVDGMYNVIVGEGEVELATGGGKVRLKKGQGTSVKSAGLPPAPAKTVPQEKINRAVATVAMKNPAVIGERMKQNAVRNDMLRAMHQEKIIERKILQEQGAKPGELKRPEDDNKARERLKRLQEEKARRMSGSLKENTGKLPPVLDNAARDSGEAVRNVKRAEPVKSLTEKTVDTTRAVTDSGTRAVDTVTETTTTVIEKTDGTVQTTVEKVTDTVEKPVQDTTEIVKETAEPVKETLRETVKEPTGTVKNTTGRVLNTIKRD